jgi:hypothetical protein
MPAATTSSPRPVDQTTMRLFVWLVWRVGMERFRVTGMMIKKLDSVVKSRPAIMVN